MDDMEVAEILEDKMVRAIWTICLLIIPLIIFVLSLP